ncbi:hypothetical protein ACFFHK_02655 [Gallibacterium trehalosifermentans]|uniref:Excisionase n=1 Tax=Gallibacterium trehalosifermentans TaxID=516935 RepID=A0ABV6H0R2_9PAST
MIVKTRKVQDRYWEILEHPKGLGFYPVEIIKKGKVVNEWFGGKNYNFATTDLVNTFINNRIKHLSEHDTSIVKKIKKLRQKL